MEEVFTLKMTPLNVKIARQAMSVYRQQAQVHLLITLLKVVTNVPQVHIVL